MAKDVFDTVPEGTMRSSKRGRIKPAPNPALSNVRIKSQQLASENADLKDRLAQLEDVVSLLVGKKAKKNGS